MTAIRADATQPVFGREEDLRYLLGRAAHRGVTIIVSRALNGKTWTMRELSRRLAAGDNYLVGCHEWTGLESSHLRYAVADLYREWLENSSLREQAKMLWGQHRSRLVPAVGQMVGLLFEKLHGELVSDGVGAIVRGVFDKLADAQKEFETGKIAPLAYEEAKSLTELVSIVSRRRPVLMLDSWERSNSAGSDGDVLSALLKNLDSWPEMHVFLCIRWPDTEIPERAEAAYRRARSWKGLGGPAVQIYELPPMRVTDPRELERLCAYIRTRVDAAHSVPDDTLLKLVDGFPGIIGFWLEGARNGHVSSAEELKALAADAWAVRYPDLLHSLDALVEPALSVAAALAYLPPIDAAKWRDLGPVLFKDWDAAQSALDPLLDPSSPFVPRFGHETRHEAARRRLLEQHAPLMARVGNRIVLTLGARVTSDETRSVPCLEALAACGSRSQDLAFTAEAEALIYAAGLCVGRPMRRQSPREFLDGCGQIVATRSEFAPLLCRAMDILGQAFCSLGRFDEAIDIFSQAIALAESHPLYEARSLNHRGLTRGLQGDIAGEISDYSAVIDSQSAPQQQRAIAHYSRAIAREVLTDRPGALADYTTVIEMRDPPISELAKSLCNRGNELRSMGKYEAALADADRAISLPGCPIEPLIKSLQLRGYIKIGMGDAAGAHEAFTRAIETPSIDPDDLCDAYVNRGFLAKLLGDTETALADYLSAAQVSEAPASDIARARNNRGDVFDEGQRSSEAIAEYSLAIETLQTDVEKPYIVAMKNRRSVGHGNPLASSGAVSNGAPVVHSLELAIQKGRGLSARGRASARIGATEEAERDFTAAIELKGTSVDNLAQALNGRGMIKREQERWSEAISDFDEVVKLDGAEPSAVGRALCGRGWIRLETGARNQALEDFRRAIGLKGLPEEIFAEALLASGSIYADSIDDELAIRDLDDVLQLRDVPVPILSAALSIRAEVRHRMRDIVGALKDFDDALALNEATTLNRSRALNGRARLRLERGDQEGALRDYTSTIEQCADQTTRVIDAYLARSALLQKRGDLAAAKSDVDAASRLKAASVSPASP